MSKENQLTPEEITSVISEQPDLYEPTVQPLDAIQQNGYYPIELDEDNNQAITPSLAKLATPKSDRDWMERLKVSAKNAVSNIMNEQLTHNVAMGNALVTIGDKEQVEYGRRMASEAKRHLDEIMDDTEQLTPEEAESWAAAIGSGSVSMVDFAANLALLRGLGAGKVGAEIGAGILAGIAGYEEGATSDIEKYIAETGDTELKNYKGDKKALAVNVASGAVQGGIEALTSGLGRYIINNPLSKKVLGTAGQNAIRKVMGSAVGRALAAGANESVNNAFEEWTQQLTGNLAEIVKGNKEFTVDNILQGAGQAAGVGALLGWMATPVMQEYGRRKTRDWVSDKLRKAADEKGIEISDAEIKKAADDLVGAIESKGVQQVTDNYEKINQITGAESDLAKTLAKAFEDLVNAGRVRFRGATEDEVRQAGLDWANWMQAQAILDSLDRGVALSEHPLNNAVAELDRIYLEGTNAGEGDLLTLDINNAQVQYLAEQIDDFIQKSQQSREQAEAARIEALREAELNARLEAVRELERNAIAELEKARQEQNERAVANLTLDLNMLTARVDSLTSELQGLITNRQQNTGRISIKQAKGLESPRKLPTKKAVELPKNAYEKTSFKKNGNQFDVTNTGNGYLLEFKVNNKVVSAIEVGNNGMVKETFTEADERRKGYGTTLVNQAEELFGPMTITIVKGNDAAKAFWTKLGYTNEIAPNTYSKAKPYAAKEVSPLAILGYRWSGVRLTKNGETRYYAFRDEKAARDFVEEAKKHGYKDEDIEVVGFDETDDRLDYQVGYASMKGEMIGDYIDANKFGGTGEGPNVHGWGNYFLASREKDRENYLKKFEAQGPGLRYDGEELGGRTLNRLGITYPETQNLLMARLDNLGRTKDWFVKTLKTYLRNSESRYKHHIENVVKQFTMLGEHTEEEISAVIKDIETIILGSGSTVGALFGFPKSTEEGKIQAKYFENEESKELFKDVYSALVDEFGGESPLTSHANAFARTVADLESQRKSLEAVKKLDFDKITGRTGLLYKGMQIKDYMEKHLDAPYMWRAKQDFYRAVRDAMALGKDPIKAIEKLDFAQNLFDEEKLKADIEKRIAEDVDPSDKVLFSRIKGAFDAFLNSTDSGASMDSIMRGLGLTEHEEEIVKDIIKYMDGEDYLVDKDSGWSPAISNVFFSIREDKAMNETLKKAKELFKDAKKEDFEYKASASMYKTNKIPENNELLDEQKPIYKQPEEIKEALKKLYADTGMGIQPVVTYNVHLKEPLRDDNIAKKISTEGTTAVAHDIDTEYRVMADRFVEIWLSRGLYKAKEYVQEIRDARNAEMEGAKKQAAQFDGDGPIESTQREVWEIRSNVARLRRDIAQELLNKIEKIPADASVSDYADYSETFSGRTGKHYLNALEGEFRNELGTLKPEDVGAKSSADAAAKLLLKYGIRGIRYFGKEDKRGFVTFEPTPVTERIYQDNVDKLVATHGMRKEGIEQALEVGGLAMPSLAITKDLNSNTYGEILFVAPSSMAQPSRTTGVYDRDAWSPMVNFIEYSAKEGFFDRVKEILTLNGVDPNSTSTFVANIEDSMGTWPEDNIMAKQLFGIYKGIPKDEVQYIQRKFDEDADLRKEYLKWYQEFIVPNLKGRIFRGFTPVRGNRSYAPATLKNIVKELKKQPEHKDFSYADFYSFADVVRELVTKFKTSKELKKESSRIEDPNKVYDENDNIHAEYNQVAMDVRTDENDHTPEFALSNAILDPEGTLAERLEKYGLKHDTESVKKVEGIIEKIKKMPARYFEAKPRRAVLFNEFKAVFVPALQEYDEIAWRLGEQGARVIRYDSSAQRDDLFNQLVSEEKDIQFQNKKTSASKTGLGKEYRGAYDPLTRAILFSKVSDVTTLFHESAHYWFDRNLRYYKTGMASPEWKDRWEKVMEELGVVPNARGYITAASVKAGSEKFARSMEAYLKTGEYENAAMQWAHQDYKNMVGRVYRNLWKNYWGLEDLSPAVKEWFNMNGFDVSNPMTAFAEKTTMDTAEEDIGNIVATDETKPDVPAVVQEEADAANGQVVENRKGEVAIVPEDQYETDRRVRSKLPESAEKATGVEMEPIMFNRRSMSDSLRAARDLVDRDPVRAWEALKTGDDMIDGLYAGDIYRALISKYKEENNPTMIKTVVQSFANAARRAGRSVKAFDLETPTVSYEGTISSLNKVFATKSNDAKVNELVKQIKNFLHDPEALNKGWEKFKEELECK